MNNHTHAVSTTGTTDTSGNITNDLKTISPEEADASGKDHTHSFSFSLTSAAPNNNSTESDNQDVTATTTNSGATSSGGSAAQSIMPPYIAMRYLIWAGV